MSSVDRGHARERRWATLIERQDPDRTAFRPRWKLVDVISMKAGAVTWFDQVKTTSRPYERFGPGERAALAELAHRCGAEARLVWWPPRAPEARVVPESDWPS